MKMTSIFDEFRDVITSGILQGMTVKQIHEWYFADMEGYKLITLQNYVCSHRMRRCLDEWVYPEDDIPCKDKNYYNLSIEVRVIDRQGNIYVAYYDYSTDVWYRRQGGAAMDDVVAWQSLEG